MNKGLFESFNETSFGAPDVFSDQLLEEKIHYYSVYKQYLPQDKKVKILDIGCGTGYFLYFLSQNGYKNIQGIDISPQMISICQANFPFIQTENIDAHAYLKNKESFYDVIVTNDVLEHIPKTMTIDLLSLFYKSLSMKGKLFIKVPNLGNLFSLRLRYTDFTHEVGFTESSLRQVLYIAGFRDIKIVPYSQNHRDISFKQRIENLIARIICYSITKLMQYQGFIAPKILSPLLLAIARKDHG